MPLHEWTVSDHQCYIILQAVWTQKRRRPIKHPQRLPQDHSAGNRLGIIVAMHDCILEGCNGKSDQRRFGDCNGVECGSCEQLL